MAIDSAHVCSADADDGMLNRCTRLVLGRFHRLLNGRDRFVQFDDYALARPARFTAVITFCAALVAAVTRCTLTSSRAAIMPSGSCTPA